MKKNYFCSTFKAFGLLPILILSVFLAYGAYIANNPQVLSIENVELVKGCFYLFFICAAVVGLADIKSSKVCFIDFVRVSGFIGSAGAAVLSFVGKLDFAPYIYLTSTVIFAIELVVRCIFANEGADKLGFKQYNRAVANKFNPLLIGILSIAIAVLASLFFDKLDKVFKYVDIYGISLAMMMVLFSLVLSAVKKNDKATIFDALLYVAFYTTIILLISSFDLLGATLKEVLLIFVASAVSILLRGQSYEGDVAPAKCKIKRYYADLYSKYDVTISILVATVLVALVVIPTIKGDELNVLFTTAGLKIINLASIYDILLYAGAAIVVVLVLFLFIFRGFKAKEIKAVDKLLNVIGYIAMIGISFVVITLASIDFNFNVIFDSIPFISILAAGLLALLVCVVAQFVRFKKYEGAPVLEAEAALEATEDQTVYAEEAASEEVVEEAEEVPAQETEVVEEVIYVDEQGNEISAEEVEEIASEEVTTQEAEVVEEVIYVDEQGNEIDPDDVPEEIREEHEPEEDEEEDDDDAEEDDADAEEPVEEVVSSKEKDIVMPEVSIVDENGQPKKIKRKFNARMMFAPYETKEYYNEIKNYLIMYRAKGRNSSRCETFRYKGLVAKVALAGKSIKVCLAIDPQSLQGSKYRIKDVSEKRQYVEVPTMIKVRSARGLKYFKELVDIMMASRGVKPKKNYQPTNFMPSLIPNGEAILGTLGMSTDYLYPTMNARGIPSELPDDLGDYLPVIQGEELDGEEVEASVYLDTLCNHFVDGDEITIDLLKEVHIVNEGNVLRIKARGTLDRKLIIYAEYIDSDALKMLLCTNCTVVKIVR